MSLTWYGDVNGLTLIQSITYGHSQQKKTITYGHGSTCFYTTDFDFQMITQQYNFFIYGNDNSIEEQKISCNFG